MLRGFAKPTRNGNGFAELQIAAKIVLAGFAKFALRKKEGLIEVLHLDGDDGLVQCADILFLDSLFQFRNHKPRCGNFTHSSQCDVTIGLYRDDLVEFRYKRE